MLYTLARPEAQGDRIHLAARIEVLQVRADEGRAILGVAVHFDPRERRLIPLWSDPEAFDPAWSTPAEHHADGSITARGPIPAPLFVRAAD